MEVTIDNFESVLQELDEVLKNADFMSIDGEFTGLKCGPNATVFDSPLQYYKKLQIGSMDFLLMQFGLSVFTYNEETKRYSQRSYNFYICPRPLNLGALDSKFKCQASCMAFLAEHGFDFNKVFKSGIPYLTPNQEARLLNRLKERQKPREAFELISVPESDKEQIETICAKIGEFLDTDSEELVIERLNGFIRRLVYQESNQRWPQKLKVETKGNGGLRDLSIKKVDNLEEEEKRIAEVNEMEVNEVKKSVGFRTLLEKISNSKKLIVGHNMLLDVCHVIHQFLAPLPESYAEFKELVHKLFPRVLDTKMISQSAVFKDNIAYSSLSALLGCVSKAPFCLPVIDPVNGRSYSLSANKYHEAGYDAFVTGVCFLALAQYLGTLQTPEETPVLTNSPLLNPFVNKIAIMRLRDIPYIDLTENDPDPTRENVFHVTFPKEWKTKDLAKAFQRFGTIFVAWLSDTSAYVSLNQREKFIEVNKNLKKFKNCKVQKYKDFQQILEEERKAGSNRTVDNGQKKSSLWRKCFCTFFALSLALLISLLCFFFFFWDQISKDNFQSFFDTSRDNFYSFFDTQSTDDTGAYSDLFQKATNVLNDAKDKLYFASDPDPDETTDESTGVISDLYQKVLNVPTVMKDYFESAAIGDYFNNFFL